MSVPSLMSADELARITDALVIDIRPSDAFAAGHIPGAASSPYPGGWRLKVGTAPGLLPSPEALAALIGATGLTPGQHAVVAGGAANPSEVAAAARVYWTLRVAGHQPVSLLDGGHAAWAAAGGAIETGPATARGGSYPVRTTGALRSDLAATHAAYADTSAIFVDARVAAQYTGAEMSPDVRAAGHFPGAHSVPYTGLVDTATGRLRPREELTAIFTALPDRPLVVYCNTGHTAALDWFVLSELLGREARLYDGSMSEWTIDPSRPVVKGL